MRKPDLLSRRRQNLEEQLPTLLSNKECQELVRLGWEKGWQKMSHVFNVFIYCTVLRLLDSCQKGAYIYTYNTCRHVHVCQCRVHKLKLLLCAAIRFRCCPVPNCFEAAKDSATRRKKFGMEWKNASPRTSRWRKRQKIMAPACWKPSLDSR